MPKIYSTKVQNSPKMSEENSNKHEKTHQKNRPYFTLLPCEGCRTVAACTLRDVVMIC